jgi:uncharacterized protein YjbI with pentapeptide repeats
MKNNGKTKITEEEKKLAPSIMEHAKGEKLKLNGASLVGLRWIFSYNKRLSRRFEGCEITNSHIEGSNLSHIKFKGSNFQGTVFKDCDLMSVNFWKSKMEGCTFVDCSMVFVNLDDANLKGSHFQNCNVIGARLKGTDFEGATFEKTNINKTFHRKAKGLKIS